jgi:enoyl-[acyl-carrier protein] reductase I
MIPFPGLLAGKRGLVVRIANQQSIEQSIAYGCANAFRAAGAELAITFLNKKAEPFVRPLGEKLAASLILPCDVREPGQLAAFLASDAAARMTGTTLFVDAGYHILG